LAAVQPFKVGLQFQISSHQAAALTEDWSAMQTSVQDQQQIIQQFFP
jgi:hypothetical protein